MSSLAKAATIPSEARWNDYVDLDGIGNIIDGGTGNDYLRGAGGIYGGEGEDTIVGAGNITGGTGDDIIQTGSCHNHNNINYANGDGNDTFIQHSDNDIIYLSGVSLSNISTANGLTFNLSSGNYIQVNDAYKKFIHVNSGGTKTYISNGYHYRRQ